MKIMARNFFFLIINTFISLCFFKYLFICLFVCFVTFINYVWNTSKDPSVFVLQLDKNRFKNVFSHQDLELNLNLYYVQLTYIFNKPQFFIFFLSKSK